MQENKKTLKRSSLARILALIAALAVIIGSIAAFAAPKTQTSGFLGISHAQADGWKTLKKGSSGQEVRNAQEALKELGYYNGKVDGNFSKAFEEAVMAFQDDFGLKKTGQLDEETYLLITEDAGEETAGRETEKKQPAATDPPEKEPFVVFGEAYSDKDHVAAYLHEFRELPPNYITKQEAQKLGWVSSWGNLWEVAPGKSIGGDRFGNYEGQLPTAKGRKYTECDIDFDGKFRNAKRIIFSSDGLIFYTEDHYSTFEEITFEE